MRVDNTKQNFDLKDHDNEQKQLFSPNKALSAIKTRAPINNSKKNIQMCHTKGLYQSLGIDIKEEEYKKLFETKKMEVLNEILFKGVGEFKEKTNDQGFHGREQRKLPAK